MNNIFSVNISREKIDDLKKTVSKISPNVKILVLKDSVSEMTEIRIDVKSSNKKIKKRLEQVIKNYGEIIKIDNFNEMNTSIKFGSKLEQSILEHATKLLLILGLAIPILIILTDFLKLDVSNSATLIAEVGFGLIITLVIYKTSFREKQITNQVLDAIYNQLKRENNNKSD